MKKFGEIQREKVDWVTSSDSVSQEFLIILKEPVPQPKKHEGKEWYHAHASRAHAEELLKKVPHDGAFLVRPSDKEPNTYVISFR